MKVVISNSISANGFLARENGEEDWLPSEGWDEFLIDVDQFDNCVMGRKTYELVTELYPNYNFDNVSTRHKVIVTRNKNFRIPKGYTVVGGPEEAIRYLKERGIENTLVIGGGVLNSEFIKRKLVDEIWMTVTPYIIGKGRPVICQEDFDVKLSLISSDELSKGRIQIKYQVEKISLTT